MYSSRSPIKSLMLLRLLSDNSIKKITKPFNFIINNVNGNIGTNARNIELTAIKDTNNKINISGMNLELINYNGKGNIDLSDQAINVRLIGADSNATGSIKAELTRQNPVDVRLGAGNDEITRKYFAGDKLDLGGGNNTLYTDYKILDTLGSGDIQNATKIVIGDGLTNSNPATPKSIDFDPTSGTKVISFNNMSGNIMVKNVPNNAVKKGLPTKLPNEYAIVLTGNSVGSPTEDVTFNVSNNLASSSSVKELAIKVELGQNSQTPTYYLNSDNADTIRIYSNYDLQTSLKGQKLKAMTLIGQSNMDLISKVGSDIGQINASGLGGGVKLETALRNAKIKIVGGNGNDTITHNINVGDNIDLGAGNNTLRTSSASLGYIGSGNTTIVKNVTSLDITDQFKQKVDFKTITGLKSVKLDAGSSNGASILNIPADQNSVPVLTLSGGNYGSTNDYLDVSLANSGEVVFELTSSGTLANDYNLNSINAKH
ncbi:MAG: hypothetical protein EOP34_07785 [Rickettsiales bacterium]|nr:MAG: hypothetical protein EOP34_07785 [Rickettsiales bacterium]